MSRTIKKQIDWDNVPQDILADIARLNSGQYDDDDDDTAMQVIFDRVRDYFSGLGYDVSDWSSAIPLARLADVCIIKMRRKRDSHGRFMSKKQAEDAFEEGMMEEITTHHYRTPDGIFA